MISPERVLPHDELLDSAIAEFRFPIDEELREISEKSLFGEILDWTSVETRTLHIGELLAKIIGATEDEEKESMLRAALFARQVLRMIYADKVILPFTEYFGEDPDADELREKIDHDTAAYLEAWPNVRQLLEDSMHAIDEGRNYQEAAMKTAALIFILSEQYMAEQYLMNSFEQLDPAMFTSHNQGNNDN